MKNTALLTLSAFLLLGCGAIDDAINNVASTGVSVADIRAKEKVLIINNVSLTGCVLIKSGLVEADNLTNAETLVTEVGVNCATYGKSKDTCTIEPLAEWLDYGGHDTIADFDLLEGEKACVIGSDL